jgi:hypothetical protein
MSALQPEPNVGSWRLAHQLQISVGRGASYSRRHGRATRSAVNSRREPNDRIAAEDLTAILGDAGKLNAGSCFNVTGENL